jgi:hypothetical protein
MPHFQKAAVKKDFILAPWVNSLHFPPAYSFSIQPIAPIGASCLYTQPTAASLLFPSRLPVFATLAIQPDKTAAEL